MAKSYGELTGVLVHSGVSDSTNDRIIESHVSQY